MANACHRGRVIRFVVGSCRSFASLPPKLPCANQGRLAGGPGDFGENRNITFEDCLAWTTCVGFKMGAGVNRAQEDILFHDGVVYDGAHGIAITDEFGSADLRNISWDTIDIERVSYSHTGRCWARFALDPRKEGHSGNVYDVLLRNINVREKGTDPVPLRGLGPEEMIRGITFDRVFIAPLGKMAASLADLGVRDAKFVSKVSIKP